MESETAFGLLAFPLKQLWSQIAVSAGSRYFWPFIVGGTIAAIILSRFGLATFNRAALTWHYWGGKSARVDYLLVIANPLIRVVFFGGVIAAAATLGDGWLRSVPFASGGFGVAVLLTAALFVADDFVRFFAHWAMHRVPFMWSFHRVHHSAETMTFATADRHHFMEILFVTVPLVATYACVNVAFVLLTGIASNPIALTGANIILVLFNFAAGAFRHGPAWVSFGPVVERWFISPAMHQIHHSVNEVHYDKNMGSTLAIWDRLFGTHYMPNGPEELVDGIGLGEDGDALNTFGGVFIEPFHHAVRVIAPHDEESVVVE